MSKREILQMFYTTSASFTPQKIFLVMCLGLAVSLIIFLTYRFTYRGVSYNSRFNAANVLILLITIVIMIMISSNIAISLGMIGALSIVRFRTAIKEPWDIVFIFWSIIEGLCIGSQNFLLAGISTLFIAIIAFVFSWLGGLHKKYMLILRGEGLDAKEAESLLKGRPYQIRTLDTTGDFTEMIIELSGRQNLDHDLLEKLRGLPGIQTVNCLLESGEMLG
ncbi:MAG: DUF4956 domain-containing protein [Lachnospiraceae bacterium]|nr:DUF4956 domain-containing protein [Lachnospiraceae bacterium]